MFLLNLSSPPVRIRDQGPFGERLSINFDVLEDVTFVPLPCPKGFTVLATDKEPRPLPQFLEEQKKQRIDPNQKPEEDAPDDGPLQPPERRAGDGLPEWRRRVQERAQQRFGSSGGGNTRPRRNTVSAPRPRPGGGEDTSESDPDAVQPGELGGDQFAASAATWLELAAKRAEWVHEDDAEVFENFKWRLTGGDYAQRDRGEAHHAMIAMWRNQEARSFLEDVRGLKMSGVFTVSKYGFRASALCAREWCHKMEFLMTIYEHLGREGFAVAARDFLTSDYVETEDFAAMADGPCSEAVREAITRIRKIANPDYSPAASSGLAEAVLFL